MPLCQCILRLEQACASMSRETLARLERLVPLPACLASSADGVVCTPRVGIVGSRHKVTPCDLGIGSRSSSLVGRDDDLNHNALSGRYANDEL